MNKPGYAVVISFSCSPCPSVLLFDTWNEAIEFIKDDILTEHEIDINENGYDSEYVIYEDEGRAVLTTQYQDGPGTVEWTIGYIFDRIEEDLCSESTSESKTCGTATS